MMHMSIAVFTVKDVMASLAYYREKLGFDLAWASTERKFSRNRRTTTMGCATSTLPTWMTT
jgi:catechol 2,3-dioxygenase-like lactoylglutathione lyase family enzyme